MERRLVDLEVRYTYLEKALAELDAVVVELRTALDAVRLRVERLEELARGAADDQLPHEKPPHY